ncbi:MAG: SDR family NAD(P)-dependent oxidoreductase [Gemmataceae bacterium]
MAQRRSIAGSRVLITGASQGIGRSLALQAAMRGARVLAAARNAPLLEELGEEAKAAGYPIKTLAADVIKPEDRLAMIGAMVERFGGMDILINNAGIGASGNFAEAKEDRLRSIFEVNVFGLAELIRHAIPVLKQGVKPAIVNISSVLGKRALPGRSEYSASKFAVQGLSEALRGELSKDGIDVIIINPGLTQTNFSQNMIERKSLIQLDHMRGMTADQVAMATLNAIERGKNEITLTTQGRLLVFMNRFFPRLTERIIARRVKRLYADAPQ